MKMSSFADRRVILLLGSPRSGTTWMASILNSDPRVVYGHEVLSRLRDPRLDEILERIKVGGVIGREDRELLIREWSLAHHDTRRPPFFAKVFQKSPASWMLISWLAAQRSARARDWFRALFSPTAGSDFEFLIKEVDWALHARALVDALKPEFLVIIRHPCAVVASQIRGQRLGLLQGSKRAEWLEHYGPVCARIGFSRQAVLGLEPCEFLALQWLVTNTLYREIAAEYGRSQIIKYEDLCDHPQRVARASYDFLGWEMRTQTEAFIRRSTQLDDTSLAAKLQFHHSYFRIYRNPAKSAGAWETTLDDRQKEQILAVVAPHPVFAEMWGADRLGREPEASNPLIHSAN